MFLKYRYPDPDSATRAGRPSGKKLGYIITEHCQIFPEKSAKFIYTIFVFHWLSFNAVVQASFYVIGYNKTNTIHCNVYCFKMHPHVHRQA